MLEGATGRPSGVRWAVLLTLPSLSTEGAVAGDLQEYVKRVLISYETGRSLSTDSFPAHGEPG